jgi:ABC-type branched-subunit amino acid transport system substrate-binding protein
MCRKVYIKLYILAAMVILLLGFVSSTPSSAAPPILIGIVEDVTGYNADAGRAERDAAIMCIDEWNEKGGIKGQKIEYVSRDNGGDPTKATTIAKEFVNLGVVGVKGGTTTTTGLAEAAVLVPAQLPYMIVSTSAKFWDLKGPDGKSYAFTFCGSDPVFAEAFVETLINYVPVHKKVVILHVNILWGKNLRDSIIKAIREKYADKGIEVIGTVEIDLKAADASKEVMRIKDLNPDGVLSIMFPEAYMAWFRACHDLDYHPSNVAVWVLAESVYLKSEPKFMYNSYCYSMFDGNKKVAVQKLEKFKKRFGYTPVGHWAMGWDAMNVLLTGIKNAGTDKVAIRDWIATKSKGMSLISGNNKAVCRIEEGSPYFYSSLYPQDYGVVYINKDGKMVWKDKK